MKNFAIIGASGYIAPRHMEAIKETGNRLIAAFDPYDGIGIIDSFFPESSFFNQFERFDRFIDKWHRSKQSSIDYISITSPNYLHDAHIRFALKNNCDVICEKPLVLNPHNIDQLALIEDETGKKVNTILQLRLHPSIIDLKKRVILELKNNPDKIFDIDLTYITSRGKWYFYSWKGDESKSGGIASNIGIHFFDMLSWIFGPIKKSNLYVNTKDTSSGFSNYKNANVRWFLSINKEYLPDHVKKSGIKTYRSMKVGEEEVNFSKGFKDLHIESYKKILSGNGFGLKDSYNSIETVSIIRNQNLSKLSNDYHPFIKKI